MNNQIQISSTAPGWIPDYVVESSPDLVNWEPIATNGYPFQPLLLTADATGAAQYFRVRRGAIPILRWALAVKDNIYANGTSALTDSYNSSDPNQSTDGQYDPTKAGSNGCVASVEGVVNIGNHVIYGDLYLGPSATFASNANLVSGNIYYDAWVNLPDVVLPNTVWWPAPAPVSGVHDFTAANTYLMNTYRLDDSLPIKVEPGVQVVLEVVATNFAPASISILGGSTNPGTLMIYQLTGSATLAPLSNGIRPTNFWYFGLPNVTNLTLSSSTPLVGVFYAPEAPVTMNSAGGLISLSGTLVAKSLAINGHYIFHFDKSLMTAGPVQ